MTCRNKQKNYFPPSEQNYVNKIFSSSVEAADQLFALRTLQSIVL